MECYQYHVSELCILREETDEFGAAYIQALENRYFLSGRLLSWSKIVQRHEIIIFMSLMSLNVDYILAQSVST